MFIKILVLCLILVPTLIAFVLFGVAGVICSTAGANVLVTYPFLPAVCIICGIILLIPLMCVVFFGLIAIKKQVE